MPRPTYGRRPVDRQGCRWYICTGCKANVHAAASSTWLTCAFDGWPLIEWPWYGEDYQCDGQQQLLGRGSVDKDMIYPDDIPSKSRREAYEVARLARELRPDRPPLTDDEKERARRQRRHGAAHIRRPYTD